jgi:hypothetical protein
MFCDVMLCVVILNAAMLIAAIQPNMQSVVLLNVIMLIVEAPLHTFLIFPFILFNLKELSTYEKSN